jgi:hypothetical protein
MLVETAFATLVFLAWRKVCGRKGMTQERKDIYLSALEHLADPEALRSLADGFEKDGLPIEASMLRKRADLRAMPREKWENFRSICERAIQKQDSNPQALEEMAQAFDAMTATGTAQKLRKRAAERRMEILAFAEEEEKRRQAAAVSETEPPPTPNNSGVTASSGVAVDPDKTLSPDSSGSVVPAEVVAVGDPTIAEAMGAT